MAGPTIHTRAILLWLIHLLFAHLIHCQCNTDQNPYCRGNSQFEQLCCTYPSVCYWSDRAGTPACCPAGTDCSSDGGPTGGFALQQTTTAQTTYLVQTVYTTTQPQYSTVTYYSSSQWSTWQPTTTTIYYTSSSQWQTWQQTTTTTYTPTPVYNSWTTVTTPAVVIVTATATNAVVAPAVTTNGVYVTVQAVGSHASTLIARDWCLMKALGAFVFVYGTISTI